VVLPKLTELEIVTAELLDPYRSKETLTTPVFPEEAKPSNFNCVYALASTPVLSKTLFILFAISLAVSPALTVTFADPN